MIAAGQYKSECEKNLVTNTVNAFKRLKARKNRASVKALLATGLALTVGGPYAFMAGAILFATELIPPPMRKKIQQNTQRILKKAGETIVSSTKNLYDRGKKVANVVAEKLVSITENVVSQSASYAQPIIETVKKTTANVVETVKEVGRKVKDKAKKAWAWLTGR